MNNNGTMIDIDIINLIITIALLVIVVELKCDRLNEWRRTNNRALSALANAKDWKFSKERTEEEKIREEKRLKYIEKLNKQINSIKKVDIYIKINDHIRLFLPIFLIFEMMHVILQKFEWSSFYEWICPGFNKIFLIIIMVITLAFFIVMIIIRKKEEELFDYIQDNIQITGKYEYDML